MQKRKLLRIRIVLFCIVLGILCVPFMIPEGGSDWFKSRKYDYQVRIGIIDTGIASSAIDEQYIENGYNYVLRNENTEDKKGHGTQIASILAGSIQHEIKGICENAVLIPLVYTGRNEYNKEVPHTPELAAKAIYDAIDIYHCDIINISAGMHTEHEELRKAVAYAVEQDVLIVASAGNDGTDALFYPGAYEGVLCVGALDENGKIAEFSQQNASIDLYAIGEGIPVVGADGNMSMAKGTSYSAAFVTGLAANLLSENPELTNEELTEKLCDLEEVKR